MSRGDSLRRLQAADDHLAALRQDAADTEATLRGDAELERRRRTAAGALAAREAAEADASSAQTAFDSLAKRARTLERRLYDGSVHNPQELLEMQHELEVIRGRVAEAEEGALTRLEELESAEVTERSSADAVRAREAERADASGPLQERLDALHRDVEAAAADRQAARDALSPADLRLYERVSGRHRPAVVSLQGDSCGGCHLPLSIEERRAVRVGTEIVQCPNCDRIVVP